jgi:LuxR family maltose regulon positive regulatory protein
LHLVIVGRHDPPLPISTLRAQSQMTEIRTQDLRFTIAETVTFFKVALGIQIDPSTAIALEEKTEGWVTGLRLAAMSMRHRGNVDPKLLEPHVDAQYVMEYLFAEVFSHQPGEISQYLLCTAILDRFCGPLCEELCFPDVDPLTCELGGWEFIAWLKKENIFVIPLDAENRWFRYHHLFQKFLFNKLNRQYSAEEIKALHARAGAWFAKNGMIEEALRHYLAAGDIPTAMQLVALHGHNLMNDQQWQTLERWLGMIPRDRVEQDPELLVFEGWLIHVQTAGFYFSAMATCLEKLETLLNNLPAKTSTSATQVKGHFDAQNAFLLWVSADGENALKHARSACENIPLHHKRARVFANIFQTGAYQMVGDLKTGLTIYHNEIKKNINSGSDYHAIYLANLCYIYWIDADLTAMRQTAELSLKIAMDQQAYEAVAFSLYFLGIAFYHQNNLQVAEEKLTRMTENFYFYVPTNHCHGSFCLSLIYQAQGQPNKAIERNRAMMAYAIDTGNQDMLLTTQAFEAELALRQGRLGETSNWMRRFHAKPFLPPFGFYMPQLTAVKILLAQNTTNSQRQASDLLDQLHDFVTSIHNIRFQIDVLALQSLFYDSQGEGSAALESLAKALALAEPGGFIRPFVDLGPQMADLLKQLIKQNVVVGYIGRIMAAFRDDAHRAVPVATDHESQSPRLPIPLSPSPLVSPSSSPPSPPLPVPSPWSSP